MRSALSIAAAAPWCVRGAVELHPDTNNVGGKIPNGHQRDPPFPYVFLGEFDTVGDCEAACTARPADGGGHRCHAFTYHLPNFTNPYPPYYARLCYGVLCDVWQPSAQRDIVSGLVVPRWAGDGCAAPPPSPGGGACASAHDCQLNGRCDGGRCACEAAWTGEVCQYLNLLPANPAAGGLQVEGASTWGGGVLHDREGDGRWHMFVAVFENHCGLHAWRPNSAIGHAVATDPEGPYVLQGGLIKPHFAHEPVPVRAADGTVLIYHIGAGANDTGPGSNYAFNCSGGCTGGGHKWQPGLTFYGPTSVLHSPTNPKGFSGPWESVDIGNCSEIPGCPQCGDTNPAPWVLPDGSVRVMWRGSGHGWPTSVMFMASAPGWRGPYTWQTANLFPNFTHTHIEDAHVWVSPDTGAWHAIFHSDVQSQEGGAAGGHAWSEDGASWTFSPFNAYGATVKFTDGTSRTLRQRERPHLILDDSGHPSYLTTAAGWQGDCDRTFTFVQPIATA